MFCRWGTSFLQAMEEDSLGHLGEPEVAGENNLGQQAEPLEAAGNNPQEGPRAVHSVGRSEYLA